MALAHRHQDSALLVEVYRVLGSTLLFRGAFFPAQSYFEQGIALYDAKHHRMLALHYGTDPGVVCRLYTALVLWVLGYPTQALRCIHEVMDLVQAISHPYSLVFALNYAARIHHHRREPEQTQALVESAMTLATEQGMVFWLAFGRMEHGWTLVEQGRGEEGMAQLREGLMAWQETGVNLGVPSWLSLLAEAYG